MLKRILQPDKFSNILMSSSMMLLQAIVDICQLETINKLVYWNVVCASNIFGLFLHLKRTCVGFSTLLKFDYGWSEFWTKRLKLVFVDVSVHITKLFVYFSILTQMRNNGNFSLVSPYQSSHVVCLFLFLWQHFKGW